MANIKKTRDDFERDLKVKIRNLVDLSKIYDGGNEAIALDMTVAIMSLVYDTKNNPNSLLKRLNKKILFFGTSNDISYIPNNSKWKTRLVKLTYHLPSVFSCSQPTFNRPASVWEEFQPHLDKGPKLVKKVNFYEWWDKSIVLWDESNRSTTRKELILQIANKDGGRHFDKEMNRKIYEMVRLPHSGKIQNGFYWYYANTPAYATIRQITHEVLMTLKAEYPEYFDDSYPFNLRPLA